MKKTDLIAIRVSPKDKELITTKATEMGLSVSSYVLMSIKKLIKDA